jgi:hypothetical protein
MTAGNKQMKTTRHTVKALTISCSILVLAGALLAVDGWAQTTETEGSTEPDASAQQEATEVGPAQEAPDLRATGSQDTAREERAQRQAFRETRRKAQLERIRLAKESPARNEVVPADVSRPATLTGMADVGGQQAGSDRKPSLAAVSLPAVASRPAAVSHPAVLSGIEVSFKLDPRHTKGLYMGEGWVSPPISIYAGAGDGTTPTVEARADLVDAKGQPVDINPEWIPADSEMVTVSPGQGNEVQITVRHAGQSSLRIASQKLYTQLSIMAWYQGDALQVEISQKP